MSKFRSGPQPTTQADNPFFRLPEFTAKYDGRCTNCDEPIEAGLHTIRPDEDGGYQHAGEDEC